MDKKCKAFQLSVIVKKANKLMTKIVLLGLFASQALAQTQGLPQGWESYLDRPDILSIKSESLKNPETSWQNLKAAHFSFVAFLLEAYPADTKIYFLARDSEYLYDVARLVTKGTADANRFHLLNVSRANMRDKNISNYLSENGISEKSLGKGEKVLFVDTGFAGTIPRVIIGQFPYELHSQLKTHLVVSANASHPSSRSFLVHLNPMINQSSPEKMHGSIVSYEHMSRYTDRSSTFALINGRYHPLSPKNSAKDGSVDQKASMAYMQDLIAAWNNPQTRADFQFEREQARWIHQALLNGSEEAKRQLKERLQIEDPKLKQITEAQVRDFFEANRNTLEDFKVSPDDLGLARIIPLNSKEKSKKNELIEKFPEWAPILENPDDKIHDLFAQKKW